MRYPFVLFDVGSTLIGPRVSFGAVYAHVLQGLGFDLPRAAYESSLVSVVEEMERVVPPGRDRFAFFGDGEDGYWMRFARRALERATGKPVEDRIAGEAVSRLREAFRGKEAWHVYPDVVPALRELRRRGARLAVVSNWDSRLPELLRTLDLASYFDTLAVSRIEGVEKPDPLLFRAALERLGAPAERALHVGDRPDLDLAGARAAGVDAVLVDRSGGLGPPHEAMALGDLRALPDLVERGI